jgi:hypothetical protein
MRTKNEQFKVDDDLIDSFFLDNLEDDDNNDKSNPIKKTIEDDEDEDEEDEIKRFKGEKTDIALGSLLNITDNDDEDEEDEEDEDEPDADDDEDGDENKNKKVKSKLLNNTFNNKKKGDDLDIDDSNSLNDIAKKLINEELLIGFDDDNFEVKSYEDLKDLIQANIDDIKIQGIQEEYKKVYDQLPDELKKLNDYVLSGGKDLKQMLNKLGEIYTVDSYDLNKESDQKALIKTYLEKTEFGNDDEIDEKIREWEDLEILDKKAESFKEKLKKIESKSIELETQRENDKKEKTAQYLNKLENNLDSAIKQGIKDIKLTDEERKVIKHTILKSDNESAITGKKVNGIVKYIEDISIVNEDYEKFAELALYISDPEKFKKKIIDSVKESVINEYKNGLKSRKGTNVSANNNDTKRKLLRR